MRVALSIGVAVVVLGVAAIGAPSGVSAPRPSATRAVAVIGDSVTERIEQLPAAAFALESGLRITVDAGVCRRLVAPSCEYSGAVAPSALEALRSLKQVPKVVVINLGYNESTPSFAAGAATIMSELTRRGVARVVWVTLRERQQSYANTNGAIRELAVKWPGVVRVLDWNAISQGQPWFEQDGVHLNTDGATQLALAIRSGLLSACGKGCLLPSRPPLQALLPAQAICTEGAGGAWAAVLATAGSAKQALALQRQAIAKGFTQSVIVQSTPTLWEIVLFGFDTRAAAVDYYLPARIRGFRLTVAPNVDNCGNQDGSWRAVFGHTTTRAGASALLQRIRASGFKDGSSVQAVVPNDYEVVVGGIQSTSQFTGFAQEALRAGFIVSYQPD
jgi:lysophospholipase L1-like esterase